MSGSIRLQRLVAQGFRNLEPLDLSLDAPFVVLHGENAQGKTNALEAIWYLSALKALRTARPRELVQWGREDLALAGWTQAHGIVRHRRIELVGGKRTVQLDGKGCSQLSEYFADLRAICFTPADGEIVSGGPDLRRRWVDRAAFTARPAHLDTVRDYGRALLNKSALLRSDRPDHAVLDALDAQLALLGARLAERRARLLAELEPHVDAMYRALSDSDGHVQLALRTAARGDDEASRVTTLVEVLGRARPVEVRRRRTLAGPQTDEVAIRLGGRPARRYASRGQVRSLVLALKLAELRAARERGIVPLFLLDDLSSELDRGRTRRLVSLLADLGAQVVATTTDPEHLDALPGADTLRLRVEGGRILA
ncbi:MAG: DNA replication and repair protein RecF [Myxococcota bacterium]